MVRGGQQETMKLVCEQFGAPKQCVFIILRELILPSEFDWCYIYLVQHVDITTEVQMAVSIQ